MALILFFTMSTGCGEASKEDYWKDENLEAAMREITGIADRDILFSDVWELTELDLDGKQIRDISALSGLTYLTWVGLTGNPIDDYSPVEFIGLNVKK